MVLEEICRIKDPDANVPRPSGKWAKAGLIMGDGYSVGWRLHDAQYHGVPQRRRRLCVLADLDGDSAGRILFELRRKTASGELVETFGYLGEDSRPEVQSVTESLSRDSEQSAEKGQGTSEDASGCVGEASAITFQERAGKPGGGKGLLIQEERAGALACHPQGVCYNPWDVQSKHIQPEDGIAESLYSGECRGGGGESYVMQRQVYGISPYDSNAMKSDNPKAGIYEADTARTLDLNGASPICNQGGMAVVEVEQYGTGGNNVPMVVKGVDAYNHKLTDDIACTMNASSGESPTHSGPSVLQVFDAKGDEDRVKDYSALCVDQGAGKTMCVISKDQSPTLSCTHDGSPAVFAMQAIGEYADCGKASACKQRDYKEATDLVVSESSSWDGKQVSPTLTAKNANGGQRMPDKDNFNAVISYGVDCYNQSQTEEKSMAITSAATDPHHIPCANQMHGSVRRLTPLECTRLQGFPDFWVSIGDWVDSKGKLHKDSDSPKYKALGNSIGLPWWQWLAYRIVAELKRSGVDKPTMASLFDGISGFPLVFYRAGCEPKWSSEIEEFPIAVAKKHFGDGPDVGDVDEYIKCDYPRSISATGGGADR